MVDVIQRFFQLMPNVVFFDLYGRDTFEAAYADSGRSESPGPKGRPCSVASPSTRRTRAFSGVFAKFSRTFATLCKIQSHVRDF